MQSILDETPTAAADEASVCRCLRLAAALFSSDSREILMLLPIYGAVTSKIEAPAPSLAVAAGLIFLFIPSPVIVIVGFYTLNLVWKPSSVIVCWM